MADKRENERMTELITTPGYLVAILWAARRSGDSELERSVRRELVARYGMRVVFATTADASDRQSEAVPQ